MTKRSIREYRTEELTDVIMGDEFSYTDRDILAIIDAAGGAPEGEIEIQIVNEDDAEGDPPFKTVSVSREEALHYKLESHSRVWRYETIERGRPTNKQTAAAYEKIEANAKRLLSSFHIPIGGNIGDVPDSIKYGTMPSISIMRARESLNHKSGEALLGEDIAAIQRIYHWAKRARETHESADEVVPLPRNMGDTALDTFFGALAEIYQKVFDRRPAITERGPYHRFIDACLSPLNIYLSEDAVRGKIRKSLRGARSE